MIRKITNPRPVAILLAVYNGEKYLAEQVDSVLAQTSDQWTLYIRDDGSTDATPRIIERYCREHPGRIVAVEDGEGNLGCRDNFFRLLETVDSPYYMFCDADDVWHDSKVKLSMDRIRELEAAEPGRAVLVVTDYTICDGQLNVVWESGIRRLGIDDPRPFLNEGCLGVMAFLGGSCMVFNDALRPFLFPVPAVSLEYDAYVGIRAAKYGVVDVMMVSTKEYRLHGANYSGVRLEKKRPLLFRLTQALAEKRTAIRRRKAMGWGGWFRYFYWKAVVAARLRRQRKKR